LALPGPTVTPTPTQPPTATSTPQPQAVILSGVKYEDQHNRWNYCGPANLSMALTFWGWEGDRDVVAAYVKPNPDASQDRNVMPYEMEDFVETQTSGLAAVIRPGGNLDLLKRLIAAGFPVVAEKGYFEYDFTGKWGWMGHYQFVTGYDDGKGVLIVQDTYIKDGKDHEFPYIDFTNAWRSFNYVFLVVYPIEREAEVLSVLGDWADPAWANQHALEVARQESETLTGIDRYFAWFNRGTSHVNLQEYAEAAAAYDQAFSFYTDLPSGGDYPRPWRMMWYQTGPYWAYYYTGRYLDTIELATYTLTKTISEPVLEESFYWRGMAYLARGAEGDFDKAVEDFRACLKLHPGFSPALDQLRALGVEP
jgi:tetratricopeptide (TPR) repeat protein